MISMVLLAFSLLGIAECDVCLDENDDIIICDYGCCTSYDYILDKYYDECCLESSLPSSATTTTTTPTTQYLPDSTSESSWSDGDTAGVVVGSISFLGIVFAGIFYRIHAYRKTGNALPECKVDNHFQVIVL
ncbi:uncharacterized protein LOC123547041 isoform X2 [Mercenaria mercenaria]|uniref:uncharacterized protein LOC123547041 isoform X2 n=1 Tax=Mercenaria mercenaria TaxID=6596 RepID=UPI00234E5752|nr:uncharacterized protein LOC123547041 isoform X2 [Mercenaria mercenaria]